MTVLARRTSIELGASVVLALAVAGLGAQGWRAEWPFLRGTN